MNGDMQKVGTLSLGNNMNIFKKWINKTGEVEAKIGYKKTILLTLLTTLISFGLADIITSYTFPNLILRYFFGLTFSLVGIYNVTWEIILKK